MPKDAEFVRADNGADELSVLGLQDVTSASDASRSRANEGLLDRVITGISLVVGGALTGVIGTFLHRARLDVGFGAMWLGIVATLLVVILLTVGIRLYLRARVYVTCFAVGVILAVMALAMFTFGHSAIVLNDLVSMIWAAGAPLVVSLIAAWPRLPARAERYSEEQSTISKEAQP